MGRRGQKRRKGRSDQTIRAVLVSCAPPCRDARTHLRRARANIPFGASVRSGERAPGVDSAVASDRARRRCQYPSRVRGPRARVRRGPPADDRGSPQRELGVLHHSVDTCGLSVAKRKKAGGKSLYNPPDGIKVAHRGTNQPITPLVLRGIRLGSTVAAKISSLLG